MQIIPSDTPHADELRPYGVNADHVDVKIVRSKAPMDRFILGMLSYFPGWLRVLFKIRAVVALVFGLKGPPSNQSITDFIPEKISFQQGDSVLLFTVAQAKEEQYWIAETPEDKHLAAYVAVTARPLKDGVFEYHVTTIVHYKHWTGPVYFNLIRPFHHLVVYRMAKAGAAMV